MKPNVLVIASHPDDEVLGCGGTIARHTDAGDSVYILLLSDGVTSRGKNSSELKKRQSAAENAAKTLGAYPPILKSMPDNKLDTLPLLDIVKTIEEVVEDIRPCIIYTHHFGDLNIDHQITHRAVMTACRPLPSSKLKGIYSFEVLSSTEWGTRADQFNPTHFVDITSTSTKKFKALKCYGNEICPFPHSRSYEAAVALTQIRGAQNGMKAAEAFEVEWQTWR